LPINHSHYYVPTCTSVNVQEMLLESNWSTWRFR